MTRKVPLIHQVNTGKGAMNINKYFDCALILPPGYFIDWVKSLLVFPLRRSPWTVQSEIAIFQWIKSTIVTACVCTWLQVVIYFVTIQYIQCCTIVFCSNNKVEIQNKERKEQNNHSSIQTGLRQYRSNQSINGSF